MHMRQGWEKYRRISPSVATRPLKLLQVLASVFKAIAGVQRSSLLHVQLRLI